MELKRKNKIYIILGSLTFLIGLGFLIFDFILNKNIDLKEHMAIENYYKEEVEEIKESTKELQVIEEKKEDKIKYIAILKIPRINLVRGLVDSSSSLNNVNYNIEIIKGSTMPNVKNGNLILAGHSGNAKVSYFRNLNKLEKNDKIIIDFNNELYTYAVVNKYEIEKSGKAKIIRNSNETTLTLITCKHNTNKQIVVIAELM